MIIKKLLPLFDLVCDFTDYLEEKGLLQDFETWLDKKYPEEKKQIEQARR